MTQITETERLYIREFKMQDAESLSIILLNTEVMKYSFRKIHSIEDIESYIKDCLYNYKKNGFGQWAVLDKKSSKLIGICGLNAGFNQDNAITHINYRFTVNSWGKGLASEAIKAVINYSKTVLKFKILYALIEPINEKSVTLALKHSFYAEKETMYRERKLVVYKKVL